MFCENCGTKLEDGTVFCTNCGAKQAEAAPAPEVAPAQQAAFDPTLPVAPKTNPLKKVPFWVWIIVAVLVVALGVGGFFLHRMLHTVNINDYIEVKYDGYNTIGTATVEIDDEFFETVFDKASYKDKKDDKEDATLKHSEADMMREYLMDEDLITVDLDKSSDLSNGDKVKVTVKVKTDKIKKKYGVTIKSKNQEFKVSGLEDIETFDPFEDWEVSFTGVDGDGDLKLECVNERDVYDEFPLYSEDNYWLSEGDTVTVTIMPYYYEEDEFIKYCADTYEMIPSVFEKDFTVEGLGSYVQEASEIEDLGDLYDECVTEIKDEVDSLYEDYDVSYGDINYVGCYVVSMSYGSEVFPVFNVNLDLTVEGESTSLSYYTYVECDDVVVADGVVTDYWVYSTPYDTYDFELGGYNCYVYGFETLEDIADDLDYYSDYYDVTNNIPADL